MNYALLLFLYKLATLFTGVLVIYWGYRLFVKGVITKAGDLDVSLEKNKLRLQNAAPGTFFTVLGAVIICFAVFKGYSIEAGSSPASATAPQEVPSLPK